MQIISARNVNDAYRRGLGLLMRLGNLTDSRNGRVIVAPWPVITEYDQPTERVLLDRSRNANPFFHLFESLWMLAGRRDGSWLDQFVHDFSERFAEDDGNIWGAYGHRWRYHWEADQLTVAVNRLRSFPDDRRTVIQMWDVEHDLWDPLEVHEDTGEARTEPRDIPCNTHVYLRVRDHCLDLTVCCRSNDAVWGAYGANAVHFSMLQEYLAGRIGVRVGRMFQLSNNFHAYTSVTSRLATPELRNPYVSGEVTPCPIGDNWGMWDNDLLKFMEGVDDYVYSNRWFHSVAWPMLWAHQLWKKDRRAEAVLMIQDRVMATDWQLAAREWMTRKMNP